MPLKKINLNVAQAIVKYLSAQFVIDQFGKEVPLFGGVFAIFGHGNVTCLGAALEEYHKQLPVYRGQNEQGMALAALAYSKHKKRRQIMIATSSIGPGALNMVTAAGVAMANRLPLLMISGDTFNNRRPDPVLQQVENFNTPSTTANDAFRAVVKYWDRITNPEAVLSSLPQAVAILLDPAETGPVMLSLPQDIQASACQYPEIFFEKKVHHIRKQKADELEIKQAIAKIKTFKKPLLIAGGGVHYSLAYSSLLKFIEQHNIPVVETVAGRGCLLDSNKNYCGPIGVVGSKSANDLAAQTDGVIAVGTRLQDFITGSWTVFGDRNLPIVNLNVCRFDAYKHQTSGIAVIGDAEISLNELHQGLSAWKGDISWLEAGRKAYEIDWKKVTDKNGAATKNKLPSYAQVIHNLNQFVAKEDSIIAAAGGFPGELNKMWKNNSIAQVDCEYGFSCMGYEISGAWGLSLAKENKGECYSLAGDGSYLMLNSDIYSSILNNNKITIVLCDNGGFAVIERLQLEKGGKTFYNQLDSSTDIKPTPKVDFAMHATAMGAKTFKVDSIESFNKALVQAKKSSTSVVIVVDTDPNIWVEEGGCWWDVGVPETSHRNEIANAKKEHQLGRINQRLH